ncbi:MAG: hypothetical protein A2729_01620 [Candidatus Buchananbacteria bacterium RIFCSPHIGHO2_01_FULL_39_14]|uniref:Uncharacterized protein n=2 Tax=Candidatus Buchananiibacteriota TaxID=1817903 RepID=A0A1G1YP02_9BACT|nr:MAG: hypothetical protein A2729_01620 [Candidatus Buchananbacteria bacterium RIFCSPHIGHO2_01_FULL_39_14]OGY48802.1 MAG: hypothetical protein A3D39_03290 [Candidatus Buchananbacteria bacterium RIFCSPHIGHO2_02_FULL_39_17]OGY54088.1 MAG: hypothetical protein A2912_01815 [Candidatus Buchananbacteria bacterium RIFCSPLOWO2_01_FULL_40_23b]
MINKITIILVFFGVLLINLSYFTIPVFAADTITDQMIKNLKGVVLPGGGNNADTKAQTVVGRVINAFLGIFGIIFLILMIYGGYKWLMASGREEEVQKAKDIIRQAIIGFIIVLSAYAISYFVTLALQQATVR